MSLETRLERLETMLLAPETPPPEWTPLPGPQTQALDTEADLTLFGGAAGGGKTDLLLGLALTRHNRSIIFRREYTQLAALEDRARQIIGWRGRYNATDLVWRLPDGRQLEFGAVNLAGDEQKFQGRPHDLKAFDEIAHFTESQFRFLIGWLRSTDREQRCRIVAVGNPPVTPEGYWVVRFFAPWLDPQHPNPAQPGELRWFTTIEGQDKEVASGEPFEHDGELIKPRSRTFIPARIEDNPYLLQAGYKSTLQALPEPLRSKMLLGDFSAGQDDSPWQTIPTAWVVAAQARWKATGGKRPTVQKDGQDVPVPMSCMGVDVARGGRDKTVLSTRFGTWFAPQVVYPGSSTPDGPAVAAMVAKHLEGKITVNVDVIGVGGSVYDTLKAQGINAAPMNASEKSIAQDRMKQFGFVNQRAEWWWKFREALDPDTGEGLALPPSQELLADLCAPHWKLTVRGIQIESKEDIAKRIVRSPDTGDSAVYALAIKTFEWQGLFEYMREEARKIKEGAS